MNLMEFQETLLSDQSPEQKNALGEVMGDKNIALFEIFKTCFPDDINICIRKQDNGYFYRILPKMDWDASIMLNAYNNIKVSLFQRNFTLKMWMENKDICIALNDM